LHSIAAALQLTTLYRTSLSSSNRSYATGYAQSLSDILDVVLLRLQQPAATAPGFQRGESSNTQIETEREELKWLVRYLRARIEAIKVEGEEEEKEESEEEDVAEVVHSSQPVSPQTTRTSIDDAAAQNNQQHNQATSQDSTMQGGQHDAPTRSNFTFSAPQDSAPSLSTANRMRRVRESGVPMPRPQSNQQQSSALLTPPTMVRASSSDDEDSMRQRTPTPSRRHSNRLGKRLTGREKLSGLELFARAQNVKRRRGMGDRRDDDDGLL
jgi:hypothetical protein